MLFTSLLFFFFLTAGCAIDVPRTVSTLEKYLVDFFGNSVTSPTLSEGAAAERGAGWEDVAQLKLKR